MNRKTSWIARAFALIALIAAIVIVFSVVTGSSDDEADKGTKNPAGKTKQGQGAKKKKVKVYVVQPDDTLTGIAAKNGVSVERIEALNPDLDPQALQAGAKLKLR